MYCQARGIGVPDPTTYAFCQALSMFRIAAILAGVGARAQQGNASSKHAAEVTHTHPCTVFISLQPDIYESKLDLAEVMVHVLDHQSRGCGLM